MLDKLYDFHYNIPQCGASETPPASFLTTTRRTAHLKLSIKEEVK